MIIDHRTYTFKPGTMGKWLDKYESEGLPIQSDQLGQFLGMFTTEVGNLHQVVSMWGYASMQDRETRRAAIARDPRWETFIQEVWGLEAILEQRIKFLSPVSFSPMG